MPPEIKQTAGAINIDDPVETIGKVFHRDARNVVFTGTPPNRRVESVPGNILVENNLLPATGTNKTIAQKYDPLTRRIYFLNYNSEGSHGIYLYNTIPGTFQRLIEVGVNTDGDPLEFTAESHSNLDIIYGDSAQGDILYFVDSSGRPSKININTALNGDYGDIQRSFLDVAKEPASIPPYVVYENDPDITISNLRKKLFRAKIRWVFDDQDKSVTSSQSEMAVPWDAFNQSTDTDPTKNCRLAIVYQTGPSNVKKVEILISNSLGTTMSDFYLVASLDKADLGIADNDIATFLFYNDKGYNNIDVEESDQLFDYVPTFTGSQTILNGNVLSYGDITEGYPNLALTTDRVDGSRVAYYSGNFYIVLVANQDGEAGFQSGQIHIIIRGTSYDSPGTQNTYTVYMQDGSSISYTASLGDDVASIIEGLRADAISEGYSIISVGDNDLVIQKTGISLQRAFISSDYQSNIALNTGWPVYDWTSKYGVGLVYFDQKGRTNGVVYTDRFSVQSFGYAEISDITYIPEFVASIDSQPPEWAYYFQWVRTKNLSKINFIQWISDRTFKDTVALSGLVKYAYISIESLSEFIRNNTGTPLSYSFSSGDRIRFFKRYNSDGSAANVYVDGKDFELVGSVTNPTINGEVKTGLFVKMILPSVDGNFDFGVSGYDNYFIELYSPAQPVANDLNIYYEFGERYQVGDPGLSTRFHQGETQAQIVGVQPAQYRWTKGDFYLKKRAIQTGNAFLYNIPSAEITGASIILMGINFVSQTYSDSNITTQNVGYVGQPVFDPFTDGRWFLKAVNSTNFRIKGTISMRFDTSQPGSVWNVYIQSKYGDKTYIVPDFDASAAGVYTFAVDSNITLENDNVFLLATSNNTRTINFLAVRLTFTIDHVITQYCIDPNFSDYFSSRANSNGRPFIFDENANTVNFPSMYRWSLDYQADTNINGTCRFKPLNFDNAERSYGAIKRMVARGKYLNIFQERRCGWTGIFQKFITDSDGNNQLVTTSNIITSNNVQYYEGNFGVGNQPTSVVSSGFVYYFIDPIRNKILRLSRDGITDLSETYKVQTWASANLSKYIDPGQYEFGGDQRVLGTFFMRPDNIGEYLLLVQGTSEIPGETFAFEERHNSFTGFYDIDCDAIVCGENILYAFRAGQLYKRSTGNVYCNFFGVQYPASITLVFNDQEPIKRVLNALAYQSNATWAAPDLGDVETNTINSQTLQKQQSLIMDEDFDVLENPNRYAAFNRDGNSMDDTEIAIWEGDYLTGNLVIVRLSITSNVFTYLFSPYITYQKDPRNF